uniref:Uncharacterized protein n=1 Tax=Anguilla anguilla TaxID=7936 RepID=A0A0E9T703_ANGAN
MSPTLPKKYGKVPQPGVKRRVRQE